MLKERFIVAEAPHNCIARAHIRERKKRKKKGKDIPGDAETRRSLSPHAYRTHSHARRVKARLIFSILDRRKQISLADDEHVYINVYVTNEIVI